MDLSQFKVRSFVIGLIVLGVLITLASWGISKIYTYYSNSAGNPKVVTISNPTPTSRISLATSNPTPGTVQNKAFATPTPRPTIVPQTTKGGVAAQPNTGSDEVQVQNPGIVIYTPVNDDTASDPIKVTGSGNVTSKKITLQVLDKDGYVLGTTDTNVCYGIDACQFETYISYAHPMTTKGYLYAFTINSLGQKVYETIIPVTF
jgi:hypothetical protein